MDIYDYLKKDHEKVAALFNQFKTSPKERQPEIARLIADELLVHAKSEQETFYKAIETSSKQQDQDIVVHGWKEHREIEELIASFDAQPIMSTLLNSSIQRLEQLVKHHVDKEEGEVFNLAKKVLSSVQSHALKELMHDLKHQLLLKRQAKRASVASRNTRNRVYARSSSQLLEKEKPVQGWSQQMRQDDRGNLFH